MIKRKIVFGVFLFLIFFSMGVNADDEDSELSCIDEDGKDNFKVASQVCLRLDGKPIECESDSCFENIATDYYCPTNSFIDPGHHHPIPRVIEAFNIEENVIQEEPSLRVEKFLSTKKIVKIMGSMGMYWKWKM